VTGTDLSPGLYVVYWRSGGRSLAAVGIGPDGTRWLAPTNWVAPTTSPDWSDVERADLFAVRENGGGDAEITVWPRGVPAPSAPPAVAVGAARGGGGGDGVVGFVGGAGASGVSTPNGIQGHAVDTSWFKIIDDPAIREADEAAHRKAVRALPLPGQKKP
jgi:hypothetical protein